MDKARRPVVDEKIAALELRSMDSLSETTAYPVLIVDDNESLRSILKEFLEGIGYPCIVASNATEALEVLAEQSIKLVISDIRMPEIDGIRFMKEARQPFPHIDFMIMTGYSSEYGYSDIIDAGAADYLTKPFDMRELGARVGRIKRERRLLGEVEKTNEELKSAIESAKLMAIRAETANLELDQIFDRSSSGIWVVDNSFEVLRMNQTLAAFAGIGKDEVRGSKCYDIFPISLCHGPDCPLTRIMRGEKTFEHDLNRKGENRADTSYLLTATPFYGLDGERMGIVAEFRDITLRMQAEAALQRANDELQRISALDDLTQLSNRRRFDEEFHNEWKRLSRSQSPLSLIFCDIDHFKLYNDAYGHQAGDSCLRAVARAIETNAQRPGDFVARYGGEEFIVILPKTDAEGAVHVAEVIGRDVKRLMITHERSPVNRYVTLSLGVSSVIPSREFSPELLLEVADRALYEAKSRGRDSTVLLEVDGEISAKACTLSQKKTCIKAV